MSDLTNPPRDQRAAPTARIRAANQPCRDLPARRRDLLGLACLVAVGCAQPAPTPPARDVPRLELWVDAFSRGPGDGSRARPYRALAEALRPGATVHLQTGLYRGPFVLPEGVTLQGHGEVVLYVEGLETTVAASAATLRGLSVQGGGVGLEAGGAVVVEQVHFSGQRRQAAHARGALTVRGGHVEGSVEGIDGLVGEEATLVLAGTRFSGGLRRAVSASGGQLTARQLSGEGVKTLLWARGARVDAEGLESALGSGPAVFLSGGEARLAGVRIRGHEYGVQAASGARLTLEGLAASRCLLAAVAVQQATLHLSRSTVEHAGLQLLASDSTVAAVTVRDAAGLGVLVRQGRARLTRLTVERVRDEVAHGERALGDAVHARDAEVWLDEVTTRDVGGSALFLSAVATAHVGTLVAERCGNGAVYVERGARLTARHLDVRGVQGSAVVVPDAATVEVERLTVRGATEWPVWAECAAGAAVRVAHLDSAAPRPESPCVTVGPGAAPGSAR